MFLLGAMVGRDGELSRLDSLLSDAIAGNGRAVVVLGEPGIGKTALVREFAASAAARGAGVSSGAAEADSSKPFSLFSSALAKDIDEPLFYEQETAVFAEIFAVNKAGLLMAKSSPEGAEEIDADIFAGMLTAVQNFVRDSFGATGGGLGRLEYGDMKILIEHGEHIFLTAVLKGPEHPEMKGAMKRTVKGMEGRLGEILARWAGDVGSIAPVQACVSELANSRFLMRRSLEGVQLESERIKIAQKVMELLAGKASAGPHILILEDAQWADEQSLFVLAHVARNVRDLKLLVVATVRAGEEGRAKPTLDAMREEGTAGELRLGSMDAGQVGALASALCRPNRFPDGFAQRLASECKGNPFFVKELLRQMLDSGAIVHKDGAYELVREDYAVPSSVEELAQRRLERLDPDSMTMAEYASCIGREFEVGAALSLRSMRSPAMAMEKLRAAGIVQFLPGQDKVAEFSHGIFRGVVYDGIAPRWRTAYHRSLGEHYERAFEGRTDEVIYELATHFSKTSEHPKALDCCTKAGEKAEGAYAPEQAIAFYESALLALPKARLGGAQNERGMELAERVGDLQKIIGAYDQALASYGRALALAEQPEAKARMHRKRSDVYQRKGDNDACDAEVKAGKALVQDGIELHRLEHQEAYMLYRKGEYPSAQEHYARILAKLEGRPEWESEYGQVHQSVGSAFYSTGEYDKAIVHLQRAAAIAEKLKEYTRLATVYNSIGNIHGNRGELKESLESYEKGLRIMEQHGDKQGISTMMCNIGAVYSSLGDNQKAEECFNRSNAISEAIGDKRLTSHNYGNLGGIYQAQGRMDDALDMLAKSLWLKEKIGDRQGETWARYAMGAVHLAAGHLDDALDALTSAIKLGEEINDQWDNCIAYHSMGELCLEKGGPKAAEAWFAKARDGFAEMDVKDMRADSLRGLVEVYIEMGALEKAGGLCEEAEKLTLEAGTKPEHAAANRAWGRLLAAKGDAAGADAKLGEALREYAELDNPAGLGRTLYDMGTVLLARGQAERGATMLDKAKGHFERAGMRLWVKRCGEALAKAG